MCVCTCVERSAISEGFGVDVTQPTVSLSLMASISGALDFEIHSKLNAHTQPLVRTCHIDT